MPCWGTSAYETKVTALQTVFFGPWQWALLSTIIEANLLYRAFQAAAEAAGVDLYVPRPGSSIAQPPNAAEEPNNAEAQQVCAEYLSNISGLQLFSGIGF
jgi:hypothetical protein